MLYWAAAEHSFVVFDDNKVSISISDIQRYLGVEQLFLYVDRNQLSWFMHLIRVLLGAFHWVSG